ncbi:MAG: histidinol-phosphate aminotransferase, partial [Chloroflexota bacterium]|nr:histidinol-phosphate aminotransferase [Chloroflexota bacterium]
APGDAIIDCPPTFGMYSFDAGLTGARVLQAWRRPDFSVDVEQIGKSANQQISKSANQQISKSANQQINESTNQRINESANE